MVATSKLLTSIFAEGLTPIDASSIKFTPAKPKTETPDVLFTPADFSAYWEAITEIVRKSTGKNKIYASLEKGLTDAHSSIHWAMQGPAAVLRATNPGLTKGVFTATGAPAIPVPAALADIVPIPLFSQTRREIAKLLLSKVVNPQSRISILKRILMTMRYEDESFVVPTIHACQHCDPGFVIECLLKETSLQEIILKLVERFIETYKNPKDPSKALTFNPEPITAMFGEIENYITFPALETVADETPENLLIRRKEHADQKEAMRLQALEKWLTLNGETAYSKTAALNLFDAICSAMRFTVNIWPLIHTGKLDVIMAKYQAALKLYNDAIGYLTPQGEGRDIGREEFNLAIVNLQLVSAYTEGHVHDILPNYTSIKKAFLESDAVVLPTREQYNKNGEVEKDKEGKPILEKVPLTDEMAYILSKINPAIKEYIQKTFLASSIRELDSLSSCRIRSPKYNPRTLNFYLEIGSNMCKGHDIGVHLTIALGMLVFRDIVQEVKLHNGKKALITIVDV